MHTVTTPPVPLPLAFLLLHSQLTFAAQSIAARQTKILEIFWAEFLDLIDP
jgi:hypothetical protein